MRGRRTLIAAVTLLGLVGAVAGVEATRGGAPAHRPVMFVPLGATDLPASPRSVLQVGRPRLLDRRHAAIWATVEHAVTATTHPGGGELVQTVGTQTPERTQNLVLVQRERDAGGETWAEVLLPSSSGTRSGWLPRSSLGALHVVDTHILISLARLQLTLLPQRRAGVPGGDRRRANGDADSDRAFLATS